MAEQLINDFNEDESDTKDQRSKSDKKGSKNKRRKRNKNKHNNQIKEESTESNVNNEVSSEIQTTGETSKHEEEMTTTTLTKAQIDEEEKKLIDEPVQTQKKEKPETAEDHILTKTPITSFKGISVSLETKSEYDKEDNYRLENELDEETKSRDVEILHPKAFTKNKSCKEQKRLKNSGNQKAAGSLSSKTRENLAQIRTRSDSTIGSNYRSPSQEQKNQCTDDRNISERECALISSPKSQSNQCISCSSEIVSLKSEEKSTCKCSSVASHQDNLHVKPEPSMVKNVSQNYVDNTEWITSSNKKRTSKGKKATKGAKTNKKNKSTKNKQKQGKKTPATSRPHEEAQPASIWNEDIAQTILNVPSPELQKCKTEEVQKPASIKQQKEAPKSHRESKKVEETKEPKETKGKHLTTMDFNVTI
jgi:hypothetical protein